MNERRCSKKKTRNKFEEFGGGGGGSSYGGGGSGSITSLKKSRWEGKWVRLYKGGIATVIGTIVTCPTVTSTWTLLTKNTSTYKTNGNSLLYKLQRKGKDSKKKTTNKIKHDILDINIS